MKPQSVAVYGATGHTGKFVVQELERRGHAAISIGRSPRPLPNEEVRGTQRQWRRASCDDPDALDEALVGASAVINCAGPFLDTAPSLVEAALRAGIHYFDIAAEQRSVRQSLAVYDLEARQRGIVILPAIAFYGGLADLLSAEATRETRSVDSIEIGVALNYWHPTDGTRETGIRNTARRLVIADGRLTPTKRPALIKTWNFPAPFGQQEVVAVPLSEIITISRHIAVRDVCSYMNQAPLRDLNDPHTPPPTSSDASGRSSQQFVMDVRAVWGGEQARIAAVGSDIYAVTAPIAVEACLRVLNRRPVIGGAYAPAELFGARGFLTALAPHLHVLRSFDLESGLTR